MDETGIPLKPRPPKVITRTNFDIGPKEQITVVGCGSVTGKILLPFIIFSAKQINPQWCIYR